jgi:hypothetical protein
MTYPSKDEFSELLDSRNHIKIVDELLIAGIPFAFRDSPADYDALRTTLGTALHLSADAMTVVGSGRIGFSLSPEKYAHHSCRSPIWTWLLSVPNCST